MNREQFLKSLADELGSMTPREREDVLADYREYFADALAAGRSDTDVAKALGAPKPLAQLLQTESRIKRWQDQPTPKSFAQLCWAVLRLGFVNLLALPIIVGMGGALIGCFAAACGLILGGSALTLAIVPEFQIGQYVTVDVAGIDLTEPRSVMVAGIGVICAGIVWLFINVRLAKWFARGLASYARLNISAVKDELPLNR